MGYAPVCLNKHDETRKTLMTLILLVLGESICRWCPKTSKLGGLTNHTHEHRTPVPLGTMIKSAG